MVYLYTEDSKAGFEFWSFICQSLFKGRIEVKNLGNKSNSSRLVRFVNNITDKNNIYLIAYDYSFDNPSVMEDYRSMKRHIRDDNFDNIILLNFISFEYILLTFVDLIDWCFSKDDELREKRIKLINCREFLLNININPINEYIEIPELIAIIDEYKVNNIEQLCSKLLFYIVRNTGFEVNKSLFGECWYVNCCEYSKLQKDDKCGLTEKYYTSQDKALHIFNNSCIKQRFEQLNIFTEDISKTLVSHSSIF